MGCRGHFGPQAEISGWNTEEVMLSTRKIIGFHTEKIEKKKWSY